FGPASLAELPRDRTARVAITVRVASAPGWPAVESRGGKWSAPRTTSATPRSTTTPPSITCMLPFYISWSSTTNCLLISLAPGGRSQRLRDVKARVVKEEIAEGQVGLEIWKRLFMQVKVTIQREELAGSQLSPAEHLRRVGNIGAKRSQPLEGHAFDGGKARR